MRWSGYVLPAAGAAAIVLAVVVTGVAAVPLLAIRVGKLPIPVLAGSALTEPAPPPDRARLVAAVVRADETLSGLLTGSAVAAVGAYPVLAHAGGVGGTVLVGVGSVALLLRARLFPTLRQRVPLLLGGAAGLLLLLYGRALTGSAGSALAVAAVLVVAALLLVVAGSTYRRRAPGPYLGRADDLLDALCVISVIPAACAVLGLYGVLRGVTS